MDIAALSMQMHADQLATNVEYSVMKKVMDTQEVMAENFLQMLPPSPYSFDVYA